MAVEVKICGMTNRDDVEAALGQGTDYIGFVLYEKSPRGVTPTKMRRVLESLPQACRAVGVFVNASRNTVAAIASDCGLHAVQIHGDEVSEDFVDFPHRLWRAVRLPLVADRDRADAWAAERYVVDAVVPGVYGGSGVRADWKAAALFSKRVPVMLAGGLGPHNVDAAIEAVHPVGVDVASGVERSPGRKDIEKMAEFIERAKR